MALNWATRFAFCHVWSTRRVPNAGQARTHRQPCGFLRGTGGSMSECVIFGRTAWFAARCGRCGSPTSELRHRYRNWRQRWSCVSMGACRPLRFAPFVCLPWIGRRRQVECGHFSTPRLAGVSSPTRPTYQQFRPPPSPTLQDRMTLQTGRGRPVPAFGPYFQVVRIARCELRDRSPAPACKCRLRLGRTSNTRPITPRQRVGTGSRLRCGLCISVRGSFHDPRPPWHRLAATANLTTWHSDRH